MHCKRIFLLGLACIATGTAHAAGTSREEATGVGAGVVIGALAGGPAGAIVGAALGAKLGDTMHKRGERAESLNVDLEASRTEVRSLQRDVAVLAKDKHALDRDLSQLKAVATPEFVALLEEGIEMDLLFRTGEDRLSASAAERVEALAASVQSLSDIRVRVDGFADERGDAEYNAALSERRAQTVRDIFLAAGISAERIETNAHGEVDSVDDTADAYALERRVSLTLFADRSPFVAATVDD